MFQFPKDSRQEANNKAEAEQQEKQQEATENQSPNAVYKPIRSVREDMMAFSERLVAGAAREHVALDYTPASLNAVDRILVSIRGETASTPQTKRRLSENWAGLQLGAYLGEVIRRHEGGAWTGDYGLPAVDLGEFVAPAVSVTFSLLTEGRMAMPGRPVDTLASYYRSVSDSQTRWLESVVRGSQPDMDSLMKTMCDDADLAQWLVVQSELCAKTARLKWNLSLDFSSDSLTGVETVLGHLQTLLAGASAEERPRDDQIDAAIKSWGVYVGEVLRRHYGGRWKLNPADKVLQLDIGSATVFPLRKVQKRLFEGPGDNIAFYFHAMGKVLKDEVGREIRQ